MKKNNIYKTITFSFLLCIPFIHGQSIASLEGIDKNFLTSLPDEVREDVMKELDQNINDDKNEYSRRPSSELSKLETVKEWEDFKKSQSIEEKTERYGLKIFNSMQSSFMPINEPNFGNNYILDYGDVIKIQLFGAIGKIRNNTYLVDIQRDGTVVLEDIGSLSLAGLNFEQAVDAIKQIYTQSFIGLDVIVTMQKTRDIKVLITGNVEFPGIYTLSGNSNILQALNVSGGPSENGSLRNIVIKRKNNPDIVVDLYKALIFGDINNIPYLLSGDSINIKPVRNLVRAGYGFNNTAMFEMLDGESISDLIDYAGGLNIESNSKSLKIVRFDNDSFNSFDISVDEFDKYKIKNLDSIYAQKENIGVVTITGNIKHPGKYSISSTDRLLDLIERSGGYTESAYPFAGSLFRESTKELESLFVDKAYRNLISFIASNPAALTGQGSSGNGGIGFVLSEMKAHKPIGRVIVDFDKSTLKEQLQKNIYLNDKDAIHIPSYDSNVYIFGEVGNPGSVLFSESSKISDYIEKSGGFTRFSSKDSIFIVSPNGETRKVYANGIKKYISQDFDVYPGSVIYVPRHIGKIDGINFYATVAPIFSSLALSIASLNSIKN
jgi:protein involved in polysaccharide export with SLBB domain